MTDRENFDKELSDAFYYDTKSIEENELVNIESLNINNVYMKYIELLEHKVQSARDLKRGTEHYALHLEERIKELEEIEYKNGWQAGYAEGFNDANK